MLETVWYDPVCLYCSCGGTGACRKLCTYPSSPAGFLHIDPQHQHTHTHIHTVVMDWEVIWFALICISVFVFHFPSTHSFIFLLKIFPSIHPSFSSHFHTKICSSHFSCPSIISARPHHCIPPQTLKRPSKQCWYSSCRIRPLFTVSCFNIKKNLWILPHIKAK